MEIPKNILRELEEKKVQALLDADKRRSNADQTQLDADSSARIKADLVGTVAAPEKQETAVPMSPIESIGPIAAPPPIMIEADPHRPLDYIQSQPTGGEPSFAEATKGELFFGYLAQIAVFAAVFLTPLFFFTSSDSVNLPKQFLLSVLALTAVGAWVARTVASGKLSWRETVLQWPWLIVAMAAVLSSIFSSSFWVSFLGDAGRYSGAGLSILSYIILAVVGFQVFKIGPTPTLSVGAPSSPDVTSGLTDVGVGPIGLIWAWLGGTFLASVYGLLQFFGVHLIPGEVYRVRVFNTIGSPFALGIFALSSVPFILAALQGTLASPAGGLNKKIKIILAVVAAVQILTAAIVDFRIGWLALAAAAVVLVVKRVMAGNPSTGSTASTSSEQASSGPGGYQQKVLLPLGLITLAVLLWFARAPQIKDLVFPAEINPSYRASLDILAKTWREKPIFGSGLETYPYVYAKFKSAALNQTNYWGVNFNDSIAEAVTWATTSGIFGTLALLSFIIAFLVYAWRRTPTSEVGVGLLASWVFILVTKFFYPTSLPLEFMFWFLPVLFVLAQEDGIGPIGPIGPTWSYRFQQGSVKTLAAFFVLLVVLIGTLAGGYFSVRRWGAERAFVKAVTASSSAEASEDKSNAAGKRDDILNGIYAAINSNPYEVRYFRVLAQALFAKMNDVVAGINARPAEERQAKSEETILLQNLTVRAINAVQRTTILDPDNVGVVVDTAESYRDLVPLIQGADDLAIQNYEKASGLEPINPFIKTQLGQLYLIKSNLFNYGLAAESELVDKARSILEKALELNPNYANARYFLSLIYDADGRRDEALRNFLTLRQTNPDNQLIAQIIQNLQNDRPALGNPPKPAVPPQSPRAVETKGVPTAK